MRILKILIISFFLVSASAADGTSADSVTTEVSECEKAKSEARGFKIAFIIAEIGLGIVTIISIVK